VKQKTPPKRGRLLEIRTYCPAFILGFFKILSSPAYRIKNHKKPIQRKMLILSQKTAYRFIKKSIFLSTGKAKKYLFF